MTAGTFTEVRGKLATNLAAITGINRVFQNVPEVAPLGADLPAVVVEVVTPTFLTADAETNGALRYIWHFKLTLLSEPVGTDNRDSAIVGMEGFPKAFLDVIFADQTLGAKANYVVQPLNFDGMVLTFLSTDYYGFEMLVDIHQVIPTTFG